MKRDCGRIHVTHNGRRGVFEGSGGTSKMLHRRRGGGQQKGLGTKCDDTYL